MVQGSILNISKKLDPASTHLSNPGHNARDKESKKEDNEGFPRGSTQDQLFHPRSFYTSAFHMRKPR